MFEKILQTIIRREGDDFFNDDPRKDEHKEYCKRVDAWVEGQRQRREKMLRYLRHNKQR